MPVHSIRLLYLKTLHPPWDCIQAGVPWFEDCCAIERKKSCENFNVYLTYSKSILYSRLSCLELKYERMAYFETEAITPSLYLLASEI